MGTLALLATLVSSADLLFVAGYDLYAATQALAVGFTIDTVTTAVFETSSTPQYNVTALIAVILRCSSCSGDFPGKVRIASIKPSCSGDMSARTKASRVSSSTTMPDSCRSLSFTGCSDLYHSLISLRSSLRFRCLLLYNRLTAF